MCIRATLAFLFTTTSSSKSSQCSTIYHAVYTHSCILSWQFIILCEHTREAFQIDAHKFLAMSTMTTFSLYFRRSQVPFRVVIEQFFCAIERALICTFHWPRSFCALAVFIRHRICFVLPKTCVHCICATLRDVVMLLPRYAYKLLASVNLLLPSFSGRLP